MNREYFSFGKSDKDIVNSLKNMAIELEIESKSSIKTYIDSSNSIYEIIPIDTQINRSNSIYDRFIFEINYKQRDFAVDIIRNNMLLKVAIRTSDGNNQSIQCIVDVLSAIQEYFLPYQRDEAYDKLLGDELAEFYRKREESLIRLESLSHQLIEDNETYRNEINKEYNAKDIKLNEGYEIKKGKLEAELEIQTNLLREKEQELNKKLKEFDDRSSKHVRRQIREDLKKEIDSRNSKFNLTEDTIKKRQIIHKIFIFFIFCLCSLITHSIYELNNLSSEYTLYYNIRLLFSVLGFAATIIYYIRWNDNWFKRHADEEFNIKRFQLDIDRASWVVEMAMEWKDEKGSEISKELIDRLTVNLFQSNTSAKITHPTEDVLNKFLNSSAELNVSIPSLGNITLNNKGVKELKKAIKENDDSK